MLLQQLRNFRFDMMRFDVMHSDRVKQCLLLGLKRLFDGSAARRHSLRQLSESFDNGLYEL